MIRSSPVVVILALLLLFAIPTSLAAQSAPAQDVQAQDVSTRQYSKTETRIEMRDGVTLYTAIYSPTDTSTEYPILLQRTPYGCGPYGDVVPDTLMYNAALVESGYIFVYQDIRGRSMSDGDVQFENLKPVYSSIDPKRIDEVTDTSDTIDWLIENVENHNGRVGIHGNSYKGWTALMGAVTAHPNLHAVLAAAPCIDIYFEDFNRYGTFVLAYAPILDWFGTPKTERHQGPWWENNTSYWADGKRFGLANDSYDFYLKKGSLKNLEGDLIPTENFFWQLIKEHPNYDEYRQQRNTLQYLRGIKCPVLVVGGWNDEQNMYGIINAYKTIESQNPDADCRLVMGPWFHGQHRNTGPCYVGNVFYGEDVSDSYQNDLEFKFLETSLKTKDAITIPEATLFDTGTRKWSAHKKYPNSNSTSLQEFYFGTAESLSESKPTDQPSFEFISDPAKPVPYVVDDDFHLFPAVHFMTGDQRFAGKRPDVLTFSTEPLKKPMSVRGAIEAILKFSTTQTDADLIVKIIDVYPMDRKPENTDKLGLKMNGYQQLVRCGYLRGRYRNSFSKPEPFVANQQTDVTVDLLDINHTFGQGHRVMVQIQSSLFPMLDRNPQKYVENIYLADDKDFVKATHRVFGGSKIVLPVAASGSDE